MELTPGALVAGRYRVERKVGAGGMGEVWAGEHVAIGLHIALKTLLPAATSDPQIVARFRREAYLLGRIRSDYVAKVIDFVSDPRAGLVLVMEFIQGEALGSLLEGRTLTIEETIDLGVDLARALCDLHRAHVVHRDLKPDNIILVSLTDGGQRAIIVDFGLGRIEASPSAERDEEITGITRADMAVGTIDFMAPEQLLSSRDVNSISDIYALGAILYRAASGEGVFGAVDGAEYVKEKLFSEAKPMPLVRFDRVARGLQSIVGRAVRRLPADRFDSAKSMLEALLQLRALAEMAALDLDGATEVAPLSSRLDLSHMPPLTPSSLKHEGENAISDDDIVDEATVDVTEIPRPSWVSINVHPPPPEAPPEAPPSVPMPSVAPPDLLTMPKYIALTAFTLTLVGGAIFGFLAHWMMTAGPR